MGRIPGYYEWDDDDLTPGQKKEGGLHQNLFDDEGKLKGSARFVPAEADPSDPLVVTEKVYVPVEERRKSKEQEELEDAIADLITVLIFVGIEKAKPHVQHWWWESFRPFVNRQWSKLKRSNASPSALVHASVEGADHESTQAPSNGLVLETRDQLKMSSAEAQARMLAAIAAQAFADEQMRLVNNAEIVDDVDADAVRESISRLPPEIVAELVRRMVTSPSMFEEESLAELASVLAHSNEQSTQQLLARPLDDEPEE